jgi:hypothetical protein
MSGWCISEHLSGGVVRACCFVAVVDVGTDVSMEGCSFFAAIWTRVSPPPPLVIPAYAPPVVLCPRCTPQSTHSPDTHHIPTLSPHTCRMQRPHSPTAQLPPPPCFAFVGVMRLSQWLYGLVPAVRIPATSLLARFVMNRRGCLQAGPQLPSTPPPPGAAAGAPAAVGALLPAGAQPHGEDCVAVSSAVGACLSPPQASVAPP